MNETRDKPTILVVDDVPGNIKTLMALLSSKYKVRLAKSGQKALDVAAEFPVDLIILDVLMPEMDGFEVCKRIKADAKTSGIPVIFVTARNEAVDEKKGYELGAVDYISKPVIPAEVLSRVQKHIK